MDIKFNAWKENLQYYENLKSWFRMCLTVKLLKDYMDHKIVNHYDKKFMNWIDFGLRYNFTFIQKKCKFFQAGDYLN